MPSQPASGFVARLIDSLGRRLSRPQIDTTRALRRDVEELRALVEKLERGVTELAGARTRAEQGLATRKDIATIGERLEQIVATQKEEASGGRLLKRQVGSLVRAHYLSAGLAAPHWLMARRFHLRSQHEEDGIILALLAETGVSTRRFVEIGSGSTGGNSAVLAHDMGWGGVMIEAKGSAVRQLREELRPNPAVMVVEARVSAEAVNDLLRSHGIAGEIDLLSIDIDSIDYWVFEALDVCTARVVVLEYNAAFGPARAVTLPNADRPAQAPKYYFGASLAALEQLARRKGYRLVLCEDGGVNAFFVRNGLASSLPGLSPADAYRPRKRRTQDRQAAPLEPDQIFGLIADAGLPLVDV